MEETWMSTAPNSNDGYMTVDSLHRHLGEMIGQGKGGLSVEVTGNALWGRPYLCEITADVSEPLEELVPTTSNEWTALSFAKRLKRGAVHLCNEAGFAGLDQVNDLLAVMDVRLKASQEQPMAQVADSISGT